MADILHKLKGIAMSHADKMPARPLTIGSIQRVSGDAIKTEHKTIATTFAVFAGFLEHLQIYAIENGKTKEISSPNVCAMLNIFQGELHKTNTSAVITKLA
jgi:hypothetical protein